MQYGKQGRDDPSYKAVPHSPCMEALYRGTVWGPVYVHIRHHTRPGWPPVWTCIVPCMDIYRAPIQGLQGTALYDELPAVLHDSNAGQGSPASKVCVSCSLTTCTTAWQYSSQPLTSALLLLWSVQQPESPYCCAAMGRD